jgi:hypothetical protein
MTTRPGYVWDNTASEWVTIGPVALPGSNVFYQSSAPSSPATGDIWVDADDEVPGITSSLNYRWRKIAAGGETSLSGNDTSGLPLAYNPGYEQVYLNGVLQYRGSDYVATTGNTITGLTALVANDTIEVLSFVTAPIGDTYTQAAADGKFVSAVNNGMFLVKPTSVDVGTGTYTLGAGGGLTFTNATVVDFRGAFTSAYQNYRVVVTLDANSNGGATNILFRYLDGSNNPVTSTNYFYNLVRSYGATIDSAIRQTTGDSLYVLGATGGGTFMSSFDLYKPNEAKQKGITLQSYAYNSLDFITYSGGGLFNATNAYPGMRIYPAAGNMTGSIRIYGYNNGA